MAARKAAAAQDAAAQESPAHDVRTVEVGGVRFEVDLTYTRSWPGVRQAAKIASSQMSDGDRLLEMVAYYERAIVNMDDVTEALADFDAEGAFKLISAAIKEATPKN